MTTYTITTPVNIDSLASKAGSDIYNINGGYLTVDLDTRYGATNQNTSAILGNIVPSATLGGTIEVNSTLVRLIPYSSGSGTMPAYGTVISQGSASAILLGVYSALNVAPIAVGASMPATGFIKVRQWNTVPYTSGALTGITATATGPDTAGWLEIVAVDSKSIAINRLNLFKVRGDYFLLGTTTGSKASTYQIPSNGSIVYLPGVWVETAVSSGVYEFYPCAGSTTALAASIATDAVRGKFCWISTAGLLRFQNDGTNSTGGYLPVSGLNIRIPNIFFMNAASATPTVNELPSATLATRYQITASGGGVLDIDKACFNWYINIDQAFSIAMTNVGVMTAMVISEIASPIAWSQVGVGQEAANSQFALTMTLCFAGGTMDHCTWTRALLSASGNYTNSYTDVSGFAITNERILALATRANATTGAQTLLRANNCSWTNSTIGGGRTYLTTCSNITYTNSIYYDNPALTTSSVDPMYMFDLASNCNSLKFDGVTFGGLTLVQPYNGILNVGAAGCSNIKLRNLGTYASPLDLGSARLDAIAWTQSSTTATITSTAHGLKTNDIIYVVVSSNILGIVVGSKTVTVTGANTFTFTCLAAGGSGTLSYYPTMCAYLFTLTAAAASNTIYIQRCYTTHTRTNLFTADNSSKNIILQSVQGDYINIPLITQLNGSQTSLFSTPSLAAQTACYGTHWIDFFTDTFPANTSSVGWARVTTVATVTSTGHNLRTGDFINVTISSATLAIVLGQKTITSVIDANTFTFTCLNASSSSGTLTFVPLISRIAIQMNEASANTSGVYTIDAGDTAFTSAGSVYMPTVNDQITFITPSYILGHTSFPPAQLVMGTSAIANYSILYAIDKNDGNGYSSFKNLNYTRLTGGGSSGSTNVTMANTAGVAVNDYIFGTGIAGNAQVQSITNGTTIVSTIANSSTVSGTLSFNQIPNETSIDASVGFKLKIQILTTTAVATAITYVYIYTNSTSTSRAYQYPLDLVPITITVEDTLGNLIQNARVAIYDNLENQLLNELTDINGLASGVVSYISDETIDIRVRKSSTGDTRYDNNDSSGILTSSGFSAIISLIPDTIATP
ncbi:MAG TPA: hypothetical protein VII94_05905 [Candidatus Saccharimonadales bacterium]